MFSKEYTLTVTTTPTEIIELTMERDGTAVVTARSRVESSTTGTQVKLTFERDAVHAFSLLLLWALGSMSALHLTGAGYEVSRETTAVGVRFP